MKLPQLSIHAAVLLLGIVIGVIVSPILWNTGPPAASRVHQESSGGNLPDIGTSVTGVSRSTSSRTRVRDREPNQEIGEPHISLPVNTVATLLHEGDLYSKDFTDLEKWVNRALESLGASITEIGDIKALIKKSRDEIYAAEKIHFKLGLVTPDCIEIDMSGIREPISFIIGRLQDDIRASLNSEAAEIFIRAIDWKSYYPLDEKLITRLEIDRKPSGELYAYVKFASKGSGRGLDKKFPDDGTPLPADQIFPERWVPFLSGLTILPKDVE